MTAVPDSFPQRFGPYVLVRLLGVGGMGDVYFALAGKLGMEKPCVVKRLAQHSTTEDGERFRREARLARKLSHGAIAQTLAVDEVEGELIIAQEFLHGCSLSGLLAICLRQREHLPRHIAVHVAREIARALAYAHEQGVTHRDIAPDNVMLTFTGEVRLLDFGIARMTSDPRLTRPGWSVGREAYAAPEVAAGASGDPRSDIYSLGVLLWQLLTRRPPPVKESLPPPSKLNPDVPADLDAIVARAAARDPADRFQRADELLRALGAQMPVDFAGEREVAVFLQKHYDIARERELLDKDLARGRAFLQGADRDAAPIAATAVTPLRRLPMPILVGAGAAAALVAIALVALRALGSRSVVGEHVRVELPARTAPATAPPVKRSPAPVPFPPQPSPVVAVQPSRSDPRRHAPSGRAARPATADAAALLAEARQRFDVGDIEGALESARAAIRAGGGAPAHLVTGQVLAKMNHLRDAERELTTAVRQDAANAAAAESLRAVRERSIRATSAPGE